MQCVRTETTTENEERQIHNDDDDNNKGEAQWQAPLLAFLCVDQSLARSVPLLSLGIMRLEEATGQPARGPNISCFLLVS